MKKTVLIFALAVLVVFSMFGASAQDFPPVEDSGSYSYTVSCDVRSLISTSPDSGDDAEKIVNGESMYGLVAIRGKDVSKVSLADEIVYIDQAKVGKDGIVVFSGFLPMGPSPDQYLKEGEVAKEGEEYFKDCTLFIGGDGFGTAKNIGVLKDASHAPSGVVISGTVVDTFAPAKTATITVKNSTGATIGGPVTTAADGKFSVTVPVGENYSVKFNKEAYLTFTYTEVAATQSVVLRNVDMSELAGDINASGTVNGEDLTALIRDFGSSTLENPNSDINASGAVNGEDLTALIRCFSNQNLTKNDWQNN